MFETETGDDPAENSAHDGESESLDDNPFGALTVGELCRRFEVHIADAFPDEVWVQGALSSLTRSANGHVYFDLIDPTNETGTVAGAKIPVALFASTRMLVNRIMRKAGGMRMHDGIEIRIRGRVAYYPPQGRIQLVMSLIDPQYTVGRMAAARDELIQRLAADGLLERNAERALPIPPLRVALITSNGSAAFADFVDEIERSGHAFRLTLFDARMQGVESVDSVVSAIAEANRMAVDVVVLIRGGGSRTDLATFDHERVALAIARCHHPVIVGVGHETDRSVADEVAHTSAKTPTACASLLVAEVDRAVGRLYLAQERLGSLASLHMVRARDRLTGNGSRLVQAAGRSTGRAEMLLDNATRRLSQTPDRILERADDRLSTLDARRAALDPVVALRRGWSITRTSEGKLVRSPEDAAKETILKTTTMGGMIQSRVTE